ncbi:MAG: hypothetical protein JSU57_00030 [Candidatus Heimdallarchaeota archaeon]|nr:MAG: hypothetical protein JSU57_00030 [Candidatus Heimdallarchaeota archaeon]
MKMQKIIWSLQIVMALGYLSFSFIPLFWFFSIFFSPFFVMLTISTILLALLGLIAFFGIATLKLGFRSFVTIFFSCGVLFYFENPYLLSLGIIITWMFYEIWFISFKYHQLDQEYSTYPQDSIEREKLQKTFQLQFASFLFLVWIVLSLVWGILLISTNLYVELGTGVYGTLGITISVAILLIVYLTQKYVSKKNFV